MDKWFGANTTRTNLSVTSDRPDGVNNMSVGVSMSGDGHNVSLLSNVMYSIQ